METRKIECGQYLAHKGEKIKKIYVLVQGTILMDIQNDVITLKNGSIIGVIDSISQEYLFNYYAEEDSIVVEYIFEDPQDYREIFRMNPQYSYAFFHSTIIQCENLLLRYQLVKKQMEDYNRFMEQMIQKYEWICMKMNQKCMLPDRMREKLILDNSIKEWELDCVEALVRKDTDYLKKIYENDDILCAAAIQNMAGIMNRAVYYVQDGIKLLEKNKKNLLGQDDYNLYTLFFEMQKNLTESQLEVEATKKGMEDTLEYCKNAKISMHDAFHEKVIAIYENEYKSYSFEKLLEEKYQKEREEENQLKVDTVSFIAQYAGYDEEKIENIKQKLDEFKNMKDVYSTEDGDRALRKDLTKIFYEMYEKVIFRAFYEKKLDLWIQMFLNFAFIDIDLTGKENAEELRKLCKKMEKCNNGNIYTIYYWLKEIYEGRKEPSKNEFDLDYISYLRDEVKTGGMSKEEAARLENDQEEKVKFEIKNMFQSTNRATHGSYSTYCPFTRKEEWIKSVDGMLFSVEKIEQGLNMVQNVDYSIFYRDDFESFPKYDISRIDIKKKVLPDMILVPNVGSKAMMWQETSDAHRDSKARFVFPMFTMQNVDDLMIECCGRFRWEICRRVQGMRWNDVREPSLTSEYCDYLQFYRKNHNLSIDGKEKVKIAMQKCKNSYREVFVKDYINWIKYESNGSIRLNKVARDIVFRYCPFTKEKRKQLMESPMFKESIAKFEILNAREAEKIKNMINRLQKAGGEISQELKATMEYYQI